MRRILCLTFAVALAAGACGGDGGSSAEGGGEVRNVLVDYKHDQFASAFLRYYPETVKVRQGDTVRFKQTWTGEPHSVTMGKVVGDMFEYAPLFEKYNSAEEALADGVTQEMIEKVDATAGKIPGMTVEDFDIYEAGAQPCFVADIEDVPAFSEHDEPILGVKCPTAGKPQPKFTGQQGLYNSGFIPYEGENGNTFEVPIADDAKPGTYQYFCNYHWIGMSGTVEIVAESAQIPSQQAVSRQARKEIEEDAKVALQRVKEAQKGDVGDLKLPLAGREADEEFAVIINEFLPAKIDTTLGEKVTWALDGSSHTISFNVPKYFPVFTVDKETGKVTWNPKSHEPVAWEVPEPPESADGPPGEEPEGRKVDVGEWDGKGGFHSSGILEPGDTFSVTFTKAGTYPFACVLHPQMVGTLNVKR